MAELALDDVERDALACELKCVSVAQLVWREATPDSRANREPAQLRPDRRARPGMSTGRAVDNAEQRPDRELRPCAQPRPQVLPAPVVHADLAPTAALAVADQQRAAPGVEVVLCERERFVDAQAAAPEHDDQRAQAPPVAVLPGKAHDRDDLLDRRRVGRVALALIARRTPRVIARKGRRRAASAGGVENYGHGHGISSQSHSGQLPPLYQHRRAAASTRPDGAPASP